MSRSVQQGIELHRAGRLDEAEAIYRETLARNSRDPAALQMMGMLALQRGQFAPAAQTLRQAATVAPNSPQVFLMLAHAARMTSNHAEAHAAATRAIALRPQHPVAYNELGIALVHLGKLEESIAPFERAVQLKPDYGEAFSNLGATFAQLGRLDEAVVALQRAVEIDPNHAGAQNNLAGALNELGRVEEATTHWRKALELHPDFFDALVNLAKVLDQTAQARECESLLNRALAIQPNDPHARFLNSMLLLQHGDLERGFADYEYRLQCANFNLNGRTFPIPNWDGLDIAGKTILLHAEQGLGDTIQFVRYVPLLAERGATVHFETPPQLTELFKSVPGISQVVSRGDPLPPFDLHASVVSLPMLFKTNLHSIPTTIPYLWPPPDRVMQWRDILGEAHGAKRVGLVWAGNPTHSNDKRRSIPLSLFAPLAQVPGVTFISLQKGDAANQITSTNLGFELMDHTDDLNHFADTAALISQLDLVISVDTSVAHLAGAMGKPVWTLITHIADWRWLLDRTNSPWYPTMRLFRQPKLNDWESVIEQVISALL